MNTSQVIKILKKNGWKVVKRGAKGSHTKMSHPNFEWKITIPKAKDHIKPGTLNQILRAAGIK